MIFFHTFHQSTHISAFVVNNFVGVLTIALWSWIIINADLL